MIFALARETGWSEHFLGEELPLARFWTYWHCLQASNPNVWTVDPRMAVAVDEPSAQELGAGSWKRGGSDSELDF